MNHLLNKWFDIRDFVVILTFKRLVLLYYTHCYYNKQRHFKIYILQTHAIITLKKYTWGWSSLLKMCNQPRSWKCGYQSIKLPQKLKSCIYMVIKILFKYRINKQQILHKYRYFKYQNNKKNLYNCQYFMKVLVVMMAKQND